METLQEEARLEHLGQEEPALADRRARSSGQQGAWVGSGSDAHARPLSPGHQRHLLTLWRQLWSAVGAGWTHALTTCFTSLFGNLRPVSQREGNFSSEGGTQTRRPQIT
ncbi:hypothetical protein WMY93_017537 [Mugilogobius chulae]|uniref:Uncharacterized protein n=1 Tax=Mugilogobius chulae TaxID=88201 RepID=A0AAW0NYN9_9GOBI